MVDNISGLPGNHYSADGLYRVKAMDRDARGGSDGGGFDRQTRKQNKETEENGHEGDSGADVIQTPLPARSPLEIHDDIVLSDVASRALVPAVVPDPTAILNTQQQAPVTEPEPLEPESSEDGSHIDITA